MRFLRSVSPQTPPLDPHQEIKDLLARQASATELGKYCWNTYKTAGFTSELADLAGACGLVFAQASDIEAFAYPCEQINTEKHLHEWNLLVVRAARGAVKLNLVKNAQDAILLARYLASGSYQGFSIEHGWPERELICKALPHLIDPVDRINFAARLSDRGLVLLSLALASPEAMLAASESMRRRQEEADQTSRRREEQTIVMVS